MGEPSVLVLHGRVRHADGSVVEHVRARILHALRAPAEVLERRFDVPDEVPVPVGVDGTIDARLDVPFGGPRVLELRSDGAAARWTWLDDTQTDQALGTIELPPAGELEVVVLDETGAPVEAARLVANVGEFLSGPDGSFVFARAARAPCENGHAILRGLPPGDIELEARSSTGHVLARGRALVPYGERKRFVLESVPAGPRDRVFVDIELPVGLWIDSRSDAVELTTEDGKRILPQWIGGKTTDHHVQTCVFLRVADAPHVLRIHDPRFLPWSMDDVRPGTRIHAKPRGPCTVALHFVATDESALRDGLPCRIELTQLERTGYRETRSTTTSKRGCVLEGLLPGSWRITVYHPLHRPFSRVLERLTPGETRDVELELVPGRILHGRVANDPDAGARPTPTVLVTPVSEAELVARRAGAPVVSDRTLATKVGESFVIDQLPADAKALLITVGPLFETRLPLPSGDVGLAADEPFVLQLPHFVSIEASLQVANRPDLSGYLAYVERAQDAPRAHDSTEALRTVVERTRASPVSSDGSITIDGVEVGEYDVWIAPPMSEACDADLERPGAQTLVFAGRVRAGDGDERRVVLDLGERSLGCVDVKLEIPGLSDAHAIFRDSEGRACSRVLVSAQGSRSRVPLPPGTYSLSFLSLSPHWAVTLARPVVVRPGERTSVRSALKPLRGRVVFEDGDSGRVNSGTVLVLRLHVEPAIVGNESFPVVAGPSGEVVLEMPEGHYEVLDGAAESGARARIRGDFAWPPRGDAPLVVHLAL